jgi:hypothetical protein
LLSLNQSFMNIELELICKASQEKTIMSTSHVPFDSFSIEIPSGQMI